MASAEQIKALLKSHAEGDDQLFFAVAMQVAAHEAKLGHGQLAEELRAMIDAAKKGPRHARPTSESPIPIARPRGELAGLLSVSYPKQRLGDIILEDGLAAQIQRVIREQRSAADILAHGLSPRRKLLLIGPPGTGKTLTAFVLAGELGIPLFQVQLDGLITKFMGETAAKLRQVFEATEQTRGVYLFDEFDTIGTHRSSANDVGEVRRILNSFLQMIEQDRSHSLILAATNHPRVLDRALFRRFDDVLEYSLPEPSQVASLLRARLGFMAAKGISWKRLAAAAAGLSHAEVARASEEAQKESLIRHQDRITEASVRKMLVERQQVAGSLERGDQ